MGTETSLKRGVMKSKWKSRRKKGYFASSIAKVGPFILDVGFSGFKWSFLVYVQDRNEQNLMHDDGRLFDTEENCKEEAKGWLHDVCHETAVNLESGYEGPKLP